MNTQKGSTLISTGVVSLITFFTLLLIAALSVLILLGAKSDAQMSARTAQSVTEYYLADNIAEQKVHEFYEITKNSDAQSAEKELVEADFTIIEDESYDGILVEYQVPINEIKYLYVKLGVPSTGDRTPERIIWQSKVITQM